MKIKKKRNIFTAVYEMLPEWVKVIGFFLLLPLVSFGVGYAIIYGLGLSWVLEKMIELAEIDTAGNRIFFLFAIGFLTLLISPCIISVLIFLIKSLPNIYCWLKIVYRYRYLPLTEEEIKDMHFENIESALEYFINQISEVNFITKKRYFINSEIMKQYIEEYVQHCVDVFNTSIDEAPFHEFLSFYDIIPDFIISLTNTSDDRYLHVAAQDRAGNYHV